MRKLRSYEEKGLLMQYHSITIEKLPKRMKNKFSNIAYQIRWSVGDDFKIIISTKSNTFESNHSDESDHNITNQNLLSPYMRHSVLSNFTIILSNACLNLKETISYMG